MAATPNIDELKRAAGSEKLADAFKLLFAHDKSEEQGFLMRLGEESDQLRAVIEKREQTITEADSFGHFNFVAATGHDCLFVSQMRDRRKLDLLAQLLLLAREGMDEKDGHMEMIEDAEDSDDD